MNLRSVAYVILLSDRPPEHNFSIPFREKERGGKETEKE